MPTLCLGRDPLLAALSGALEVSRWVTLIGPPGSGKTLVARRAVADLDRVVWADVRGIVSRDDAILVCLDALGAEYAPGDNPTDLLAQTLDGSGTTLVIDGVEVDVTGLGVELQRVLDATTGCRLLATSPTMAGERGEWVLRVGPLPLPSAGEALSGPAVELFLARVQRAGGHPVDLAADAAAVHALISATAGLPLLIEQVAAMCALVGLRATPPTPSLGEAVDAAYALLEPDQRRALRRIGLLDFAVGPELLASVTGTSTADAGAVAAGLVRRSLLEVLPDGRFDMLSPIRSHCRTLSDEEDRRATDLAMIEWADRMVPTSVNFGAADQPWLVDLPAIRFAVQRASESPATRARAYEVANRAFSGLYTAMHTRDAVDLLQTVLDSGDAPAGLGSMVARRAGIASSELHGTYEGLWLLERADEYARADDSVEELAKNASIRAEMHLDAGDFASAEADARRAIDLDGEGGSIIRQATRTLADVHLSSGRLAECIQVANAALPLSDANSERWITLSARTLLARVALERGRIAEAVAAARAVVTEAQELAENRIGLLAETVLRGLDRAWQAREVDRDLLPWAVRLPVLAQDARDLFATGDSRRAAGLAADVAALADAARLGRDAVEARLLLGRALHDVGEVDQATTTFLTALEQANAMPMRLRVADVLAGLASIAQQQGLRGARELAASAIDIRLPQLATPWGYAAQFRVEPARSAPGGWISDGVLTATGLADVAAIFMGAPAPTPSALDALTAAERQVADRVADGLTSRRIGEELFISPRTVDAHLTNIYRKLDINTRARLAAMVADAR